VPRKRLRRMRALAATVRVSVFDRAGNVRSTSRPVVIAR
jgi:hypothetical protein